MHVLLIDRWTEREREREGERERARERERERDFACVFSESAVLITILVQNNVDPASWL